MICDIEYLSRSTILTTLSWLLLKNEDENYYNLFLCDENSTKENLLPQVCYFKYRD